MLRSDRSLQTLPVEEEICDPEESLCKVGCAPGARAVSGRQRAAAPVLSLLTLSCCFCCCRCCLLLLQTPLHVYEARCTVCSGTGWARAPSNGRRGHLGTCIVCHGLGETAAAQRQPGALFQSVTPAAARHVLGNTRGIQVHTALPSPFMCCAAGCRLREAHHLTLLPRRPRQAHDHCAAADVERQVCRTHVATSQQQRAQQLGQPRWRQQQQWQQPAGSQQRQRHRQPALIGAHCAMRSSAATAGAAGTPLLSPLCALLLRSALRQLLGAGLLHRWTGRNSCAQEQQVCLDALMCAWLCDHRRWPYCADALCLFPWCVTIPSCCHAETCSDLWTRMHSTYCRRIGRAAAWFGGHACLPHPQPWAAHNSSEAVTHVP